MKRLDKEDIILICIQTLFLCLELVVLIIGLNKFGSIKNFDNLFIFLNLTFITFFCFSLIALITKRVKSNKKKD